METKIWAIELIILCTIFTSIAQIFYKRGSADLSFDIMSWITNIPLIIGWLLYILGAIIMIIAFKGGEVSVLYPIIATSYIWVCLMSAYFFNETFTIFKIVGVLIIIIGIILISRGSKETIEYTGAI